MASLSLLNKLLQDSTSDDERLILCQELNDHFQENPEASLHAEGPRCLELVENSSCLELQAWILELLYTSMIRLDEGVLATKQNFVFQRRLFKAAIHVLKKSHPSSRVKDGSYQEYQEGVLVACDLIRLLAINNKREIIARKLNALPVLILLLKSPYDVILRKACGALHNLSLNEHNISSIVTLGALPLLIKLLKHNNEQVQLSALGTLANLSTTGIIENSIMQLGGVTEILTILANKLPRPIPSSYPSPTTTALTNTTLTDERLSLFTHLIRCLCNLSRNSSNKLVIANSGLQSLLRLGLTIITSFAPTPYNQLTIFNATARSVSDDITHQNILSAVDAHDNDDGDKSEVKMSRIATSAISADSNNPFSVQEEEKRMHAEILFHTVGVVRNLCVDPTLTQKLLSNELVQDFVLNVMHQTNSALNVNHLCSRDFASTASRSDASRSITDIDAQADIATSRGKRHNERGDDTRDGGKHQTSTVSDTVDEDDDRRTDDNVRLTLATKVECVESLAFLRGFCSSISSISSPLQSSDAIGAPHSSLANEDAALRAIRFLVLHEEIQQIHLDMYGAYDFSKWKKLLRADNLVQIEVLGFLCWITANQIYLAEQTTDGEDLFDALSRHLHRLPTLVITSLQETGKFNKFSPLFQSAMDLHASELTIANSPDAVGATEVNFQTFARLPPCTLVSHLNTAACISTLARTTSVTPSSPSISVSSSLPSSASAASRVMDVISKLKYRLTFHEYVFLLARIIDSKFSTDYSRNRLDVSSQCLNPALNNMVLRGSPSSHIDGSEGYPGQRQLASLTDSAVIHVDIDDETDSTCTSAGTISSYNESSHSLSVDAAELYPSTPSPRFSPHQQVSYRCVTPKRKQTNEALTSPTPHPLHRSRFTSDTPSRKKRRRSMTDKNTLNEMKTKLERQKTLRRQEQQQIQAQLALQSYYTQRNAQLLSNIETLKDEVEETLCQICCREQKDTVILPCTHMFYCNGCFSKLQMTDAMAERSSRCPCCRVSISGTLHLALVNRK